MVLPVYLYGQPVLRKVADDVEREYPNLTELIANMFETMYDSDGIGLAAPQIGLSVRLIVIDADPMADDFPECKSFKRVLINARILEEGEDCVALNEGCLSLPGIHEKVSRPSRIKIQYLDENFKECVEELNGFAARVVQHEYDHLDGKMFIDHISAIRKQLNKSKLNSIVKGTVKCAYRAKAVGK